MSYRIHRKSRQQADVEIYGGPLKQHDFRGGMNIDAPASEIGANEIAYAENVICREHGLEARSGTVRYSTDLFTGIAGANVLAYSYNPASYTGTYQNYRHTINYNGVIRSYKDNPGGGGSEFLDSGICDQFGNAGGTFAAGTGDCTLIPYKRGYLAFTATKISYTDPGGSFQVNAANPVHGLADDHAAASTHIYRYLFTLSRIVSYAADPTSFTIPADRLVAGAEMVHESGTNGNRYSTASTSTARDHDYGEVYTANSIDLTNTYTISAESLTSAWGSLASITDNSAPIHFTHVSVYRTLDVGTLGVDGVTGQGNNTSIYVWLMDVKRNSGTPTSKIDNITDATLRNRIASQNLLLKTQGFTPMPSGSCAAVAGGWMFVSDRSNATPETVLNYCAIGASPENVGYYFAPVQNYRFSDGIRALKANQDILSIFCNSSTHICNLTSVTSDLSKVQYIPFLNYFHCVDYSIGVRDWGTLDSIDQNSLIAVCSDASVRIWDTTKWGDDLSYDKVNSEISQIVPASPYTYARGSVGRYYKGAYYLWYSKDTADTATTKCLRYGMGVPETNYARAQRAQAGYGWTFYTGWVYPMFKTGVQVITDNNGVQRMIVISKALSGAFYWVETFDAYVGSQDLTTGDLATTYRLLRKDTDLGTNINAGNEIVCVMNFREMIGAEEADVLVHDETFIKWRPQTVAGGFRTAFSVALSGYKDGSATATETVTNQPKTASIKFTSEIAARRVQLGITTGSGFFRMTGIESHFRSLDKVNYATSGDVSSSESTTAYPQYQAEYAGSLTHWVSRRETGIDRATGTTLTVSGTITLMIGPDGATDSGYLFSTNTAKYTESASNTYASTFSVSFWAYIPPTNLDVFRIAGTNPMYVQFTNATTLSFSGLGTVTVSSVAAGWHHFVIERTGTTISVYQNNVLKGTITSGASLGGGNLSLGYSTGAGGIADFRVFTSLLSVGAIGYYYNDVINNAGKNVMPLV